VVLSTQIRGVGRPLVLLPWFGLGHAVMAAAFEPAFAGSTDLRRIYIDLPGTGDSPPVAPHSDAVLDAVEETVDATVGSAPFLLAGCSYGGYLAAGLARRAPTRVLGLLLVCPGVKIRRDQRNLSRVVPTAPEPRWLDEVPEKLHAHFGLGIGNQTRSVANRIAEAFALNGPTDDDYLASLRSNSYALSDETSPRPFDGNVTILAGTRDRIAGHLDQFDALAHYRHGSFVALGDAGHYLPFEQPARFQALALDWLRTASASRPPVQP
jgi:pimeloyl-ACP methyl ester carboxylesterase